VTVHFQPKRKPWKLAYGIPIRADCLSREEKLTVRIYAFTAAVQIFIQGGLGVVVPYLPQRCVLHMVLNRCPVRTYLDRRLLRFHTSF
jgi:hypothetical protein